MKTWTAKQFGQLYNELTDLDHRVIIKQIAYDSRGIISNLCSAAS